MENDCLVAFPCHPSSNYIIFFIIFKFKFFVCFIKIENKKFNSIFFSALFVIQCKRIYVNVKACVCVCGKRTHFAVKEFSCVGENYVKEFPHFPVFRSLSRSCSSFLLLVFRHVICHMYHLNFHWSYWLSSSSYYSLSFFLFLSVWNSLISLIRIFHFFYISVRIQVFFLFVNSVIPLKNVPTHTHANSRWYFSPFSCEVFLQ